MNLSTIIRWVTNLPLVPEECHVKGCHERDIEPVTIKRFDPIDHDDKETKLCAEHQAWAAERNALAEEIYEDLREARKDVGDRYTARLVRLTVPQGEVREDVLDGSIKNDATAKDVLGLEDILQ